MQLYGLAFGESRIDLWKKTIVKEHFNKRLEKVVGDLNFTDESFSFYLKDSSNVIFYIQNNYLYKIKMHDEEMLFSKDEDIKNIILSYFRKNDYFLIK